MHGTNHPSVHRIRYTFTSKSIQPFVFPFTSSCVHSFVCAKSFFFLPPPPPPLLPTFHSFFLLSFQSYSSFSCVLAFILLLLLYSNLLTCRCAMPHCVRKPLYRQTRTLNPNLTQYTYSLYNSPHPVLTLTNQSTLCPLAFPESR